MKAYYRIVMLATMLFCAQLARGWACMSTNPFDGRRGDVGTTVRAVEAAIFTYPSLPDLHGGSSSSVWCMIQVAPGAPRLLWAQAGYTLEDNRNYLQVFAEYTDVSGIHHATFVSRLNNTTVPESGTHTYKCDQDSNGRWSFYYDGNIITRSDTDLDTSWAGTNVFFSGEAQPNATVQMMGDTSNKVRFSSLKCRKEGETSLQSVWPTILVNGNPDQWGQDVDQGAGQFDIYDTTP